MNRKASYIGDQRGVVALELPAVYLFLMLTVLLPLADVAIAGLQFTSARQALRNFGYSIQYTPPDDVTVSTTSWADAALAKADSKYPISNFRLVCGDSDVLCSASNDVKPRYYSYTTTVTLAPIVLKKVLCTSGTGNGCMFTLSYSEQFQ